MLRTKHEDVEEIGEAVMVTTVILNDCPVCSAQIKVILPLFAGQLQLGGST